MLMPIPICPYRDFQMAVSLNFVRFVWKGINSKDEKFVWFSVLFNAYQAFWRDFQLQQDKPYLAFTCSKATIKTLEQDINTPKQHCQKVFCCLYCYLWTYFLLSSSVFIVDFEHLNDGRQCQFRGFNNRYKVTINISKNSIRMRLFLQ